MLYMVKKKDFLVTPHIYTDQLCVYNSLAVFLICDIVLW